MIFWTGFCRRVVRVRLTNTPDGREKMTVHCLVIGVGKMGAAHLQALAELAPDSATGWAPGSRPRATERDVGGAVVRRDDLQTTLAADTVDSSDHVTLGTSSPDNARNVSR